MKILQVYPYFTFPVMGGMENVVYNLSSHLSKKGHEVTILAGNMNHFRMMSYHFGSVRVIKVPTLWISNYAELPLSNVKETIKENEVIHVHCLGHLFTNYVAKVSLKMYKPTVVSWLSLEHMVKHLPLWAQPLGAWLVNEAETIAKNAHIVQVKNLEDYVTVTTLVNSTRAKLVPDGIPEVFLKAPNNGDYFRKKYGLEDKYIVLYVGRIDKWKGVKVLTKTIPIVTSKNPKAFYIYVGSGSYLKHLKITVQRMGYERFVLFTGYITEQEKIAAYDAANVVVIPSLDDYIEAFSIVASEAWARGKPVVASVAGALKHRVVDGVNGFLVKPNSPVGLADGIVKAFNLNTILRPSDVICWHDVTEIFERIYQSIG